MVSFDLPFGRLYGPGWLHSEIWFPGFKCVWTAERDQSGHHCPDSSCDGAIKTSCYYKLHVAFCVCVVDLPNGQQAFCGHRFQAESPKACALHGWGDNDENRIFQRAKKDLSFELPKLIPYEQPGWEMALSGFGGVYGPIHIRMGLIDSQLYFARVLSFSADGQPDQVESIARVKDKELRMTDSDPRVALKTHKAAVVESPAKKAIQALARTEQNDDEYNDPYSYRKYAVFKEIAAGARKLEEKKAKEMRAVAQEVERLAPTKGGKKCVHSALDIKKQLRVVKAKKK